MKRLFTWLNPRRLRDYPRLILIALLIVALANLLLRQGWQGGVHGIIGFDFMAFYSSGLLYWNDISHLYDFATLNQVQQQLIAPVSLNGGANIFSYPPYVALACSLFTLLPYAWSFIVWIGLSLLGIIKAVRWMTHMLLPDQLHAAGLDSFQLSIITLSFFPTYIGLQNGQNQAFTLFLVTGVIVFARQKRWLQAGVLAGLLIYKPQFVVGFLILWLAQGHWRALFAFGAVAATWGGLVLLTRGIEPYLAYLNTIPDLLLMPYGVALDVEITPSAFIATLLGLANFPITTFLTQLLLAAASIGLGWYAYRVLQQPVEAGSDRL
jgi:hypothetical protein